MLKNKDTQILLYVLCMIVVILFICNIVAAVESETSNVNKANVFTALSGWVSFLATVMIGVIALYQSEKFSNESAKTNKAVVDLTKQIENLLWLTNMSTVDLNTEELMTETFQKWVPTTTIYYNEPKNVAYYLFKKTEKYDPTQGYYQNNIEIVVINNSGIGIDSIEIDTFSRVENGKQVHYDDALASFTEVRDTTSNCIRIIFHILSAEELGEAYFNKPPQIIFTLIIKNVRGIRCKKTFQIGMMVLETFDKGRRGMPYIFYHTEYERG